jgi:hypothetical protein
MLSVGPLFMILLYLLFALSSRRNFAKIFYHSKRSSATTLLSVRTAVAAAVSAASWVEVEVSMYPLNDLFMSKVEQVESELRKLSQAELRRIREWLDDIIEDEMEFTPEFEHAVQQAERDMANGKSARVREP